MTINENKYRYIPLLLPNIQVGVSVEAPDQTQSDDNRPQVDTFMRPLVTKLAMRHPEWRLVTHQTSNNLSSFSIYKDGEKLGEVSSSWRGHEKTYSIRSHRTEKVRTRKNDIETKDVGKAVKTAERFFAARTLAEKVEQLQAPLHNGLYREHSHAHAAFQSLFNSLVPHFRTAVVSDWETLYKKLQEHGLPKDGPYDVLPETYERSSETQAFYDDDAERVAIYVVDGQYVVKEGDGELVTHDEVPAKYKRAVGMLKLAGDKTFVSGIGYRHDGSSFYVYRVKEKAGGAKKRGSKT